MKRISMSVLIGLLAISVLLSACGGLQPARVRVATDANWAPFEVIDEQSQEISGFDIDLMRVVAEKGGFEVEFVNVAWEPLLEGMAKCQYDAAISVITITAERKEQFAFSDPYFAAGQVVTVKADNTDIASKDALSGKTVGVQTGTTSETEAQKIVGAEVRPYTNIDDAFQDLLSGALDAVIADNPLAMSYIGQYTGSLKTVGDVFTDEYYGIAVCKTNTALLDKINKGLATAKQEGIIDQLTIKWISGPR